MMDGPPTALHTADMTYHLPVGASYDVVQFEGGMFGVEVTTPSCRPSTFLTEMDATGWAAERPCKTREQG